MNRLSIYVDAAVDGNPGPAGIAAVAVNEDGQILARRTHFVDQATNNVAEYLAVLEGLALFQELNASTAEILTDSQLVARQLSGQYRVRDPELMALHQKVAEILVRLGGVTVGEISREDNQAHQWAVRALRRKGAISEEPVPMVKIAASLLAADLTDLRRLVSELEEGGVDWLHIDVMDGHFVPNITFGIPLIEHLKKLTSLPLDVHLMVEEPDPLLEKFVKAGADIVTVHCEASRHLHRSLDIIKGAGARAGVALNPATPALWVQPVLPIVDLILVMTVDPGMAGQTLLPFTLPKVQRIRSWLERRNPETELEVDGGVNEETAGKCVAAGASVLVSATGIFQSRSSVKEAVKRLREKAARRHPLIRHHQEKGEG